MNIKKSLLLLVIIQNVLLCQTMYWHCVGSGGSLDTSEGSTTGQTVIADFTTSDSISVNYGYWFNDWTPVICFSIIDTCWIIEDSVDSWETINMTTGEQIAITNCGNCYLDYGIRYDSTSTSHFTCDYPRAEDKYSVCARFSNSSSPPGIYIYSDDYIRDSWTWSTETVFGESGVRHSPEAPVYLWMQFLAPTSIYFEGEMTVYLQLGARVYIP